MKKNKTVLFVAVFGLYAAFGYIFYMEPILKGSIFYQKPYTDFSFNEFKEVHYTYFNSSSIFVTTYSYLCYPWAKLGVKITEASYGI